MFKKRLGIVLMLVCLLTATATGGVRCGGVQLRGGLRRFRPAGTA